MSLKEYFIKLLKPNSHVTEWTYTTDKLPKLYENCDVIAFEVYKGKLESPTIRTLQHTIDGHWKDVGGNVVVVCWKSIMGLENLLNGDEQQ